MQKIFITLCGIFMTFNAVHAVSDARTIRALIEEKNQKLNILEQCTKKVTGFKVAGISTIGLTAVGIAGDIALVKKNKEMDTKIASAKHEIKKQQEKLKTAQDKIAEHEKNIAERKAECDKHNDIAKWDDDKCVCRDGTKQYKDGTCIAKTETATDNNNNHEKSGCVSVSDMVADSEFQRSARDAMVEIQQENIDALSCNQPIPFEVGANADRTNYGKLDEICKTNYNHGLTILDKGSAQVKEYMYDWLITDWTSSHDSVFCEDKDKAASLVVQSLPPIRFVICDCEILGK